MGQHFELLRLDYDIDLSSIIGSNIWNANGGQLGFLRWSVWSIRAKIVRHWR